VCVCVYGRDKLFSHRTYEKIICLCLILRATFLAQQIPLDFPINLWQREVNEKSLCKCVTMAHYFCSGAIQGKFTFLVVTLVLTVFCF
jgi:hypothetical protein